MRDEGYPVQAERSREAAGHPVQAERSREAAESKPRGPATHHPPSTPALRASAQAERVVLLLLTAILLPACDKVPLVDINAQFALANATWFEAEQTLFVFYRVNADQGLGPDTQVELTYRTDQEALPWTPIRALEMVHTHVDVDCGPKQLCGSASVKVALPPREVGLRMRYHRDGEMTLGSAVTFNVIGTGPPHTHRSLLVYGVFDGPNHHVQWRARHQFPTLRNQEAEALGLRRRFTVTAPGYGDLAAPPENPYGYGLLPSCPGGLTALGWEEVETWERAIFDPHPLPLAASTAPAVCAEATVEDALGTFTTLALARKNPEVRPAFPVLRSPITQNTPIGFVLHPCQRAISGPHLAMQRQRLLLEGAPEICIDDWDDPGFASQLTSRFQQSVDLVRPQGKDMVLVVALHHDDESGQVAALLEQALQGVLAPERDKSSPRVSGAFVFDSLPHTIAAPDLKRLVLWCPANLPGKDLDQIPAASERSCPVIPDQAELLTLGPFRVGQVPILPTRPQYLTFIDKYSEAQAGKMLELRYLAPERTPISENVPAGEFGVVTFFNNERISAAPTDAFSYCPPVDDTFTPVVFRTLLAPDMAPLEALPDVHSAFPQPTYELGLLWDFPFLLHLEYEVVVAGAGSAYGFTVPFGIASLGESAYGAAQWEKGEFSLVETLEQCTRFCDHPTFDSAGVYNVTRPFRQTYARQCYRPVFPVPGDGGSPLDP